MQGSGSTGSKFKAMVILAHLFANGPWLDSRDSREMLESNSMCSIAVDLFLQALSKGTAVYEGEEWEVLAIAQVLLCLSSHLPYATKMVKELDLTEGVVHMLTFLGPEDTALALVGSSILCNLCRVEAAQVYLRGTGAVVAAARVSQ